MHATLRGFACFNETPLRAGLGRGKLYTILAGTLDAAVEPPGPRRLRNDRPVGGFPRHPAAELRMFETGILDRDGFGNRQREIRRCQRLFINDRAAPESSYFVSHDRNRLLGMLSATARTSDHFP